VSQLRTTRRLLGWFRPYRARFALALVLMSLQAMIPGALVLLIEQLLDRVLIERDAKMLGWMPLMVIGLYGLNGLLTVGRGMLTRTIAWDVITRLRAALFAQYLRLDLGWHQTHPTGILLARLTNDVNNIQYGVSGIVTAVQQPLTLVALLAAAAWMNPMLTGIAVIGLPLVAWPISRFGRKLRHSVSSSLNNMAALTDSSQQTLSGIEVVQAFGAESERIERFEVENQTQMRLQMQAFMARLLPGPVIELIAAVAVGTVLWVGGQQVFSGQTEPGELIAFMVALGLLNDPLKGIAKINNLNQQAIAGAQAVFEVLDQEPAVADEGTLALPDGPLDLELVGVDFDYGEGQVLHQVNLHVPAGSVSALVGHSGAGKSTIARLLLRSADPTGGHITLGGVDIKDLPLAELRRAIAVVTQAPFLFDDSVRANISLGLDASDSDIQAAAQAANAHEFIMGLPDGYDTRVREGGSRLSGGECQRLCIARAFLRDAPLLILDEATSALDAKSEAAVQEALSRLMEDRTVVAIAHRLSTVRGADEIAVMDHGALLERGTHSSLMASEGIYADLVGAQLHG
jgi:subfamily B ATP-binding cassette protein MsbA